MADFYTPNKVADRTVTELDCTPTYLLPIGVVTRVNRTNSTAGALNLAFPENPRANSIVVIKNETTGTSFRDEPIRLTPQGTDSIEIPNAKDTTLFAASPIDWFGIQETLRYIYTGGPGGFWVIDYNYLPASKVAIGNYYFNGQLSESSSAQLGLFERKNVSDGLLELVGFPGEVQVNEDADLLIAITAVIAPASTGDAPQQMPGTDRLAKTGFWAVSSPSDFTPPTLGNIAAYTNTEMVYHVGLEGQRVTPGNEPIGLTNVLEGIEQTLTGVQTVGMKAGSAIGVYSGSDYGGQQAQVELSIYGIY